LVWAPIELPNASVGLWPDQGMASPVIPLNANCWGLGARLGLPAWGCAPCHPMLGSGAAPSALAALSAPPLYSRSEAVSYASSSGGCGGLNNVGVGDAFRTLESNRGGVVGRQEWSQTSLEVVMPIAGPIVHSPRESAMGLQHPGMESLSEPTRLHASISHVAVPVHAVTPQRRTPPASALVMLPTQLLDRINIVVSEMERDINAERKGIMGKKMPVLPLVDADSSALLHSFPNESGSAGKFLKKHQSAQNHSRHRGKGNCGTGVLAESGNSPNISTVVGGSEDYEEDEDEDDYEGLQTARRSYALGLSPSQGSTTAAQLQSSRGESDCRLQQNPDSIGIQLHAQRRADAADAAAAAALKRAAAAEQRATQSALDSHRLRKQLAEADRAREAAEEDIRVLEGHADQVLLDCRQLQEQLERARAANSKAAVVGVAPPMGLSDEWHGPAGTSKYGNTDFARQGLFSEDEGKGARRRQMALEEGEEQGEMEQKNEEGDDMAFVGRPSEQDDALACYARRVHELEAQLHSARETAGAVESSLEMKCRDRARMQGLAMELAEVIESQAEQQRLHNSKVAYLEGALRAAEASEAQLLSRISDLEVQLSHKHRQASDHERSNTEARELAQGLRLQLRDVQSVREQELQAKLAEFGEECLVRGQEAQEAREIEGELRESLEQVGRDAAAAGAAANEHIALLEEQLAREKVARREAERLLYCGLEHQTKDHHSSLRRMEAELSVAEARRREAEDAHLQAKRKAEDRVLLLEEHVQRLDEHLAQTGVAGMLAGSVRQLGPNQAHSFNDAAGGASGFGHANGKLNGSKLSSRSGSLTSRIREARRNAAEALHAAAVVNLECLKAQLSEQHQLQQQRQGRAAIVVQVEDVVTERTRLASLGRLPLVSRVAAVVDMLGSLRGEVAAANAIAQAQDKKSVEEHLQDLDLAIQLCQDELRLLLMRSAVDDIPEDVLEVLMALFDFSGICERTVCSERTIFSARPMHWAAQHGRRDIVELLIGHELGKSMVNCRDRDGATPLFYADRAGYVSVAQYLRERVGATVASPSAPPSRTLDSTASSARGREFCKGMEAVQGQFLNLSDVPREYHEALRQVENRGWSAVGWQDGFTLLHWAAGKGRAELCRYLLELRAETLAL